MPQNKCSLYKQIYAPRTEIRCSYNFIVYRDDTKLPNGMTIEELAYRKKVATFIDDYEAQNYCNYRNAMIDKYGSDSILLIKEVNGISPLLGDRE